MAKKPKPWTSEGQRLKEQKPVEDGGSYLDGVMLHKSYKLRDYQEQMLRAMQDPTSNSKLIDDLLGPQYGGRQQGKTAMQQGKEEHERMMAERGYRGTYDEGIEPRMERVMLVDPLGDAEELQYAVVQVARGRNTYEAYDQPCGNVDFYDGSGGKPDRVQMLTYRRIDKTVFGHAIFELTDDID